MALFDFLKKKSDYVVCARCGAKLAPHDAKLYGGHKYCSVCYPQVIPQTSSNTEHHGGTTYATAGTTSGNSTMPATIQDIKQAFDKASLKYNINHVGDQWELVAGINGKANTYQIKYICKETAKGDVAMRVFRLTHFSQDRWDSIYPVLQQFQRKYRYLKFNLDKDGDVNLEYDFPLCTTNTGACAVELLIRTMKMVDDIYPELMHSLWG